MIAGGTGITPMLQVMQEVARNPEDKTKVTLVFANVTEQDILCRKEIDEICASNPQQFSTYYVLDKPPAGWKGGAGYISQVCTKYPCLRLESNENREIEESLHWRIGL